MEKYISITLANLHPKDDKNLIPEKDIKCNDCVHAIWTLSRDKTVINSDKKNLECYCKTQYKVTFSTMETPWEVLSCDAWSNSIADKQ